MNRQNSDIKFNLCSIEKLKLIENMVHKIAFDKKQDVK